MDFECRLNILKWWDLLSFCFFSWLSHGWSIRISIYCNDMHSVKVLCCLKSIMKEDQNSKFLKVTFSFKKWQQNEDLGRKYLSSSSHDHQMILKSLFSFRFGHTTVPPGIYRRDRTCNFRKSPHGGMALRLCSTWWDSQVFHLQDSNEIFYSWNESSSIQWFINSATMCREGYRIACWIKVCNPSSLWAMTPYYWSLWVSTC